MTRQYYLGQEKHNNVGGQHIRPILVRLNLLEVDFKSNTIPQN